MNKQQAKKVFEDLKNFILTDISWRARKATEKGFTYIARELLDDYDRIVNQFNQIERIFFD